MTEKMPKPDIREDAVALISRTEGIVTDSKTKMCVASRKSFLISNIPSSLTVVK